MKKGTKVKISESNDNDNYNDFREKTLIVTHSSNSGPYYDRCMHPQMLMDLKTEEGEEVPFSLYEYEVQKV